MVNRVNNTPIAINTYNAWGLTVNNSVTKNCVRQANGTLWSVVGFYGGVVNLYKSTDDGFSWSLARQAIQSGGDMREAADLNADGLFAYIVIDETFRNLDLIYGEWENIGSDGSVERKRFDLDDVEGSTPANTTVLATTDNPAYGMFDVCSSPEAAFLVWIKFANGSLNVTKMSPRSTSIGSDTATGASNYGHLSSVCTEDGKVHIAHAWLDGANRKISYTRYDSTTPSFDGTVVLENLGATPAISKDISIAIDGLGTLCVIYFDQGDEEVRYRMSRDGGDNWDAGVTLTRTSGHATYTDAATSDKAGRTNIIGSSQGGFILTYVEDNSDGTPRAYLRQLTTDDDGTSYDLQEEKEVATSAPWTDEAIVGVQFFHPTDIKLMDLSEPGLLRIAYTIGEGDSLLQTDTLAISFGQELLYESAFPTSLTSELSEHSLDTADDFSLLVLVDIHAGPNELIDFHAAGMVGGFTERYIKAFERIGTSLRILRYEPIASNYLDDRTAYGAPEEFSTLALIDPVTYSFPSPALTADITKERIEQDVRKIHIRPEFFLERTFLINKGGYLKRTVWLCELYNNQYEISQVIPRFINNQICYYEANAYVVGPSRDPFSRITLPSET